MRQWQKTAAASILALFAGVGAGRMIKTAGTAEATPPPAAVVSSVSDSCAQTLRGPASAAMFTLASSDALDVMPTRQQVRDAAAAWQQIVEACR